MENFVLNPLPKDEANIRIEVTEASEYRCIEIFHSDVGYVEEDTEEHLLIVHVDEIDKLIDALQKAKHFVLKAAIS